MNSLYPNRFSNRIILITGGSSGIGYAVGKRLANEGAKCILVARSKSRLSQAVNELPGNDHLTIAADCKDEQLLVNKLEAVCNNLGPLYAGVFCAGVQC